MAQDAEALPGPCGKEELIKRLTYAHNWGALALESESLVGWALVHP